MSRPRFQTVSTMKIETSWIRSSAEDVRIKPLRRFEWKKAHRRMLFLDKDGRLKLAHWA